MRKSLKSVILVPAVFIAAGCGGGSDSPSTPGSSNLTGTLVDSPVSGVSYSTETMSDITNASGQFEYKAGETVTFTIGDIVLGSNEAQETITPLDLLKTNNVNDDAVVNMLRLLQTLDDDGDLSNGIGITPEVRSNATEAIDFNQPTADFEIDTTVTALTQAPLVDAAAAVTHFEGTLSDVGYENGIVGVWAMDGVGANETLVVMATEGGKIVFVQTGSTDPECPPPTCQDGMEVGTYAWDATTGAFTVNISTDTNGEWGLSHSTNMSVIIDGDSATFTSADSNNTLTRISGTVEAIHGGWEAVSGMGDDEVFFFFFENGKAVHVQAGVSDLAGQSGVEVGTYTWDASSGALSVTLSVDTNGEWGFSDSTDMSFTVNGDVVTISAQDGGGNLSRIF